MSEEQKNVVETKQEEPEKEPVAEEVVEEQPAEEEKESKVEDVEYKTFLKWKEEKEKKKRFNEMKEAILKGNSPCSRCNPPILK